MSEDSSPVAAITAVVKPFTDPVLGQAGEYIADRIRFARWKWSVRAVQQARDLIA